MCILMSAPLESIHTNAPLASCFCCLRFIDKVTSALSSSLGCTIITVGVLHEDEHNEEDEDDRDADVIDSEDGSRPGVDCSEWMPRIVARCAASCSRALVRVELAAMELDNQRGTGSAESHAAGIGHGVRIGAGSSTGDDGGACAVSCGAVVNATSSVADAC